MGKLMQFFDLFFAMTLTFCLRIVPVFGAQKDKRCMQSLRASQKRCCQCLCSGLGPHPAVKAYAPMGLGFRV